MNNLKKILLGSKHAKQTNTSPLSTITSGGSEHDIAQTSTSSFVVPVSRSSFFRRHRSRHSSGSQLKPSETSPPTTSSVSDHQDAVETPTVGIPLFLPEHPDGTVSELRTVITTTVPKIDVAHVSEGEVSTSNTVTQSVLQGAHNVNFAGATFSVVGGDQINHTGTPRMSCAD
jgi:hypothetical protein